MALPEQQPEVPLDQQVQEIPDVPEIPAHVEQATGVSSIPSTPQPVQGDNQQTVQPIPAPKSTKPSVTIPAISQAMLQQMARGNATDSQSWFGVFWLKKIKKALKEGLEVLFGKQ